VGVSASDASVLREAGIGPGVDPRIKKLDLQIEGLREARRLLADAMHILRWGWWRGRESSHHGIHALSGAREKIGRDLRKLKAERAELEERIELP
jgi:hypothetical protein